MKHITRASADLCFLIKSFLSAQFTPSVADQFEKTFSSEENFEDQNFNYLVLVRDSLRSILDANLLSDLANQDLGFYLGDLEDFIVSNYSIH